MGKLDGKVALITGSGRNIGRATALKLASEGAHIVVNARTNQAEADAVAREVRDRGVKAISVLADMAKKDQVDALAARRMHGRGDERHHAARDPGRRQDAGGHRSRQA